MSDRAEIDSRAQEVDGRAMSHAVRMNALVAQGGELRGRPHAVLFEDPAHPEPRQRFAAVITEDTDGFVRSYALAELLKQVLP